MACFCVLRLMDMLQAPMAWSCVVQTGQVYCCNYTSTWGGFIAHSPGKAKQSKEIRKERLRMSEALKDETHNSLTWPSPCTDPVPTHVVSSCSRLTTSLPHVSHKSYPSR